ncbi:MAG: hypothetical protein AB7S81_00185 [Bdellovibrionales bacterium]
MSFDMNEVEPQRAMELIPDGTFVKLIMHVRPGGTDGSVPADKGLLKASANPGSDVLMLDCEFTVTEGPHARRKLRQNFVVAGGKPDDKGQSMAWNISKRVFRAMIDSACGLDPADTSEEAKSKRRIEGLSQLDKISFVGKIAVEPSRDPKYSDRNVLDRPILPDEKEWKMVMDGQDVPPSPSRHRAAASQKQTQSNQPAWQQGNTSSAQPPAWQKNAPTSAQQASTPAPAKAEGPAWLKD